MMIIGCDYHPGFQQIAFVDTDSGELQERRLRHREKAETFYRNAVAFAFFRIDGLHHISSTLPLPG